MRVWQGAAPGTETYKYLKVLARPEGFRPPASWFEARRSIRMSYGRVASAARRLRALSAAGFCSPPAPWRPSLPVAATFVLPLREASTKPAQESLATRSRARPPRPGRPATARSRTRERSRSSRDESTGRIRRAPRPACPCAAQGLRRGVLLRLQEVSHRLERVRLGRIQHRMRGQRQAQLVRQAAGV